MHGRLPAVLLQHPQDQVMIAVSRVTPEVVRKLGVAMTAAGDVQVGRSGRGRAGWADKA